jgi:outer membrane protein TolC
MRSLLDDGATEKATQLAREYRAVIENIVEARGVTQKREYIPDVEAFARYSYQNDVPFLARSFGTFGIHFSYDIFDGGKKRSHRTIRLRSHTLP